MTNGIPKVFLSPFFSFLFLPFNDKSIKKTRLAFTKKPSKGANNLRKKGLKGANNSSKKLSKGANNSLKKASKGANNIKIPCNNTGKSTFDFLVWFYINQTLYKLEKTEYNRFKLHYTGGKNGIIR